MAQFEDTTPVDPTTITPSETRAVKREATEPTAQTDTVPLVGVQVEVTPKS
jgi:hypothetical protein